MRPAHRGWVTAGLVAAAAACSFNPVTVESLPLAEGFAARRRTAIEGELSRASRAHLHRLARTDLLDAPPAVVAAAVRDLPPDDGAGQLLGAELLLLAAQRAPAAERVACQLDAAQAAWRAIAARTASSATDPVAAPAIELYGYALAALLQDRDVAAVLARGGAIRGLLTNHPVRVVTPADDWPVGFFDALEPAAGCRIEGVRSHHQRLGLGVPLVAMRRQDLPDRAPEPFYPPEGRCYPATLVLQPATSGQLEVRLVDPRRTRTVAVAGREVAVAADLTTPYAQLLARARLHDYADQGFFRPEWRAERYGFFLLEPYSRTKLPVVLIHGLWSSPLVWRELTNEIWGDDEIAARCQVWHYMYPTGTPILNDARDLRESLAQLQAHFDPDGDDPAMQDLVLVGHSMGGVIAKTVVQASGDAVWNVRFAVPPGELLPRLPAAERDYAQRTFFFTPLPQVRRVVFVGAPHRGSAEADSWLGRLGAWLQAPSERVAAFATAVERVAPGAMRPEAQVAPGSVDLLSQRHPVITALADLSIAPGVRYHTIVGNLAPPGEEATDGVVTNASSRIAGAASELVLPGAGHDLQQDPRAIAEILRILATHLGL